MKCRLTLKNCSGNHRIGVCINYQEMNSILGQLKHGIKIALDDFGTDSSLAERELNINCLKIDKFSSIN